MYSNDSYEPAVHVELCSSTTLLTDEEGVFCCSMVIITEPTPCEVACTTTTLDNTVLLLFLVLNMAEDISTACIDRVEAVPLTIGATTVGTDPDRTSVLDDGNDNE